MDMKGEYRIPAPRQKVWEALNDPEILKICIPGCESLEKTGEHEMAAEVTAKVGPLKAQFKGEVSFENINAPESYTITGEGKGKGGVAGFAKGGADVHLAEEGEATVLTYEAYAQVGGKLAQLGSRLIDSTARKMADDFFGKFSELLGGAPQGAGDHSIAGVVAEVENAMEDTVRDAEEWLEVEAGKGTLGDPMVWGLIGLAVLIVIILIANIVRGLTARRMPGRGAAASPDIDAETGGLSMATVSMTVNGKAVTGEVEGRTLLVQSLREGQGLTGTHVGCDTSQCGACVVHVDGKAVKSCTMLAAQADGCTVTTIEGLARGDQLHPVQADRVPRTSRTSVWLLHARHDHVRGRHDRALRRQARRGDHLPRA